MDQIILKPRRHQKSGQPGKSLQMHVRALSRSRYHKQQIGQGAVKSVIIHPRRHGKRRQPRFLYCRHFGVGDSDPVSHCRTSLGLPGKDPLLISGSVIKTPSRLHKAGQPVNGVLLGSQRRSQFNTLPL